MIALFIVCQTQMFPVYSEKRNLFGVVTIVTKDKYLQNVKYRAVAVCGKMHVQNLRD